VGRFRQMRELMGSMGGGGLLSRIPGLGRLAGAAPGLPGGFDPEALLAGGGNRQLRRQDAARRKAQAKKKRKAARASRRKGRRR
jgi:hypothetical protein